VKGGISIDVCRPANFCYDPQIESVVLLLHFGELILIIGLQPNRRFGCNVLFGVFYVVGQDSRGNLTSLSPAAMEKCQKIFALPALIDSEEAEATMMAMFCSI